MVLMIGLGIAAHAQLNEYKYIVVPKKFAAFKGENKFQTSTLTKYYFTQEGFTAVYDDEMPMDLATNRCLGLFADILDDSNMLSTKLTIALKNCKNEEVFRTSEGKSKLKDYDDAYKEAIQDAFKSFRNIDYQYQPKQEQAEPKDGPVVIRFKDDVKNGKEEPKKEVVEQVATVEEQTYKSMEPQPSKITKAPEKEVEPFVTETTVLYAQPIEGGYQLVDKTPKVVMKLQETSMENIYLTTYEGQSAMVFKKGDQWFLEYPKDGVKQLMELQIKF